jgi:hypothetical protein
MKKQTISLLLALAVAVVFSGCATSHHPEAYEYKLISGRVKNIGLSEPTLGEQLNQAAADGWQVLTAAGGAEPDGSMIILKRRK